MAARPAKEVLGISAMGVPIHIGRTSALEVPWASSSAWSLPSNSYSAPALSSLPIILGLALLYLQVVVVGN